MNFLYLISKFIKKLHVPAIKESKIDKTSKICSESQIVNTVMDRYSYIGSFCTVIDAEIGSFSSIADNCIIGGANHPIEWVSTSPVFYKGSNVLNKNFSHHEFKNYKRTIIGNDVWVGSSCIIKGGVKIGDGAVIGMGAIVTKDVGPYEIWGGNPAKIIRKRFDDNTINDLLKIKWWQWDETKIKENADLFNEPKALIDKINNTNRKQ